MTKFIWFIPLVLFLETGRAQIFGGTPPSVHWKYIHTPAANIIYPTGQDSAAAQVAFLVSDLSKTTLPTIGNVQKPVDIIFRNLTTIPNGYVQLAPFRSEFQLTPSQNSFELGSLPWNQMLAIHEYRHVQQYNNFCVGLARAFYFLFGQDGLAFANSLSVPNWFFEGDAVYQETLVSRQGRGRLPYFLTGYEALWVSGKNYSWMKLRNGSYRDYTPDYYPLGYMLVAYGRDRYGNQFWEKTAREAAAFKGLFYPLQKAIKKNAGISFDTFRTRALGYFRDQLPEEAYTSPAAIFGKTQNHFVSDELFAQFTDSNHLIFVNSNYRLPPSFVIRQTGSEKTEKVKNRAVTLDDAFSYHDRKIAYTAYEPDLRWGWRDYSVIRLLNLDTKKDLRLTSKTKYFSPDISGDGKTIVAVNMHSDGKSSLDILDIQSGRKILELPNPQDFIYTYPKYFSENHIVSAVRNRRGQMTLLLIDVPDGTNHPLLEWSMSPIGFISVDKDKIFFTKTDRGTDQGFYFQNGRTYEMNANASAGNYQLSGKDGKLVWSRFSSAGFRATTASQEFLFQKDPVSRETNDSLEKHNVYSLEKPVYEIPDTLAPLAFNSSRYSPGTHLFNFHSWRPYINDPDYTFSLLGQNVLNTFQSEIYVGYNSNERYKKVGMDYTYGGLFPLFNTGVEYRIDRIGYFDQHQILFNELLPYAGISVPLNLSRGRWLTSLEAGTNLSYHQPYFSGAYKDSIGNISYFSLDPQLVFTNQLQAGRMQIYPSFAQTLLVQYDHAISGRSGNQFLASANIYLPGLSTTHSLILKGAVQQRDSLNQVSFSNSFPFANGYSGVNFYRMYGLGAAYHIPLAYPDWGFANIVYFLRVRADAFFNYTGVPYYATNGQGVQTQYRSAGLEVYFDTKWWNELSLSFGIRYSRLLDPDYLGQGPNQWELILPLNILSNGYSSHLPRP